MTVRSAIETVRSGIEIVDLHDEYQAKIRELEEALLKLDEYSYTKSVLLAQLGRLRDELKMLETTRFQALEPVTVTKSALGGHDFYVS